MVREKLSALQRSLQRSKRSSRFMTRRRCQCTKKCAKYAKSGPRKLRPRFLSMQIAARSNDDLMPWAQIDGTNFSFLFYHSIPLPRLSFPHARASFPFGVPAILSVMVRTDASIWMQSESYHFAERIFSYGSSSAKSALLSRLRLRKARGGEERNVK